MLYRVIFFLVFCAGVALGQGETIIIPQVGTGLGLETTVNFMSGAVTTDRLLVRAYDNDGNPLDVWRSESPFGGVMAVDTRGVEIAGYGARQLESYTADPNTLKIGYAEVTSEFGHPFAVEVVFRTRMGNGEVITTTNVLPQAPLTEFSFLAFSNAERRSGIAVVNPRSNDEDVEVTFSLYDRFGSWLGDRTVVLSVGSKLVQFIDEGDLFPELLMQQFLGTMEVRSTGPVAMTIIATEGAQFVTQTIQLPRNIE